MSISYLGKSARETRTDDQIREEYVPVMIECVNAPIHVSYWDERFEKAEAAFTNDYLRYAYSLWKQGGGRMAYAHAAGDYSIKIKAFMQVVGALKGMLLASPDDDTVVDWTFFDECDTAEGWVLYNIKHYPPETINEFYNKLPDLFPNAKWQEEEVARSMWGQTRNKDAKMYLTMRYGITRKSVASSFRVLKASASPHLINGR